MTQALEHLYNYPISVEKNVSFTIVSSKISGLYLAGLAWIPGQFPEPIPMARWNARHWLIRHGAHNLLGLSFIIPPKSTNCVWNRDGSPEGNQIAVIRRRKNRVWVQVKQCPPQGGMWQKDHWSWCHIDLSSNLKAYHFLSAPAELPELMGSS